MSDATQTAPSARDRHLFAPGPKRILALDGGGVRGAMTVAFLERIEALLCEHHGREVRLGDYLTFAKIPDICTNARATDISSQ